MDYPYYIIDLSNIADFVIRVQYDTEDRKRHGTDKCNRHAGNKPGGRRKAFGGSHNQYRNKRPYKRGYRVHEDGVCRREYGNEDRTARTTSRRDRETRKPGTESKGGIKSVTTGKITINGDRKETTATTATETGERKAETQTSTGVNADKTATVETEQEKKPKRGLLDWIFLAGIVAACAAGITYAVRRFKIKAGK